MRIFTALAIVPAVVLFAHLAWAADNDKDILIVVNKSLPVDSVSADELRSYFLKKNQHWKSGTKVLPINAKEDSELRTDFRSRLLNMSADQEMRYWQDIKIRTGTMPPPEFGHVLKAVFKLKGAIGYVYRSDYRENVSKIVFVIPAE